MREPVGVVGCITPWNYPLHQIVAKVAPALAAGCTVVLKPSEVAPLNAFMLAEVVHEVGLPAGVFNLVTGLGPVVGEAHRAHPGVDMVSFTGSTRAGKRVAELAAQTVKRVALELGGKSANVILDDADLETGGHRRRRQRASSTRARPAPRWTRMLVPRGAPATRPRRSRRRSPRASRSATRSRRDDGSARWSPTRSASACAATSEKGVDEGATLVTGGAERPKGSTAATTCGRRCSPTSRSDMTIAQEEIFGPVLSIMPYDDEDDAVRIANDTIYGLAGGVWSGDPERAKRVARRLRTGQVDINGGGFNPLAPFGGYKQSGHGRELGKFGLEEFLETKSLQT